MGGSLKTLRAWHALVAVLAVAAYVSDDVRPLHQWLGYAIAAMILIRLFMAVTGAGPLGLRRFYPRFHDLRLGTLATHPAISSTLLLGIATSLIGVTTTGILMDQGRALQAAPWSVASDRGESGVDGMQDDPVRSRPAHAEDGERDDGKKHDRHGDSDEDEGPLEDIHEFFANLLIALVALHVTYLVVFKWPLARFMLFISPRRN